MKLGKFSNACVSRLNMDYKRQKGKALHNEAKRFTKPYPKGIRGLLQIHQGTSIVFFLLFTFGLIIYSHGSLNKPIVEVPEKPNSVAVNNTIKCSRTNPYNVPPELERARSLRQQRLSEYGVKLDFSFYNCIHIMYADLSKQNAEGLFTFDKNSSIDDLRIYVDESYKEKDDLLTAILLDHEYVHVSQFVNTLRGVEEVSCVDSEVEAFLHQVNFLRTLTPEEVMSLAQRLIYYKEGGYQNSISRSAFATLDVLIGFNAIAKETCRNVSAAEFSNCYFDKQRSLVEEEVRNSEFYRKQCNL